MRYLMLLISLLLLSPVSLSQESPAQNYLPATSTIDQLIQLNREQARLEEQVKANAADIQNESEKTKNELMKEIDIISKEIEYKEQLVEMRVSRMEKDNDFFNSFYTVVGLIVTISIFGFGFLGYKKAKDDAIKIAENSVSDWFESRRGEIERFVEDLKSNASASVNVIYEFEKMQESIMKI